MLLICEVTSANPDSGFEYHWTFNGTSLNQTFLGEISTEEGYMSKIVIPTTDDSLFGTWTCSVRNTVGQTEPNCTLFVDAPLRKCPLLIITRPCSLSQANNFHSKIVFYAVLFCSAFGNGNMAECGQCIIPKNANEWHPFRLFALYVFLSLSSKTLSFISIRA